MPPTKVEVPDPDCAKFATERLVEVALVATKFVTNKLVEVALVLVAFTMTRFVIVDVELLTRRAALIVCCAVQVFALFKLRPKVPEVVMGPPVKVASVATEVTLPLPVPAQSPLANLKQPLERLIPL